MHRSTFDSRWYKWNFELRLSNHCIFLLFPPSYNHMPKFIYARTKKKLFPTGTSWSSVIRSEVIQGHSSGWVKSSSLEWIDSSGEFCKLSLWVSVLAIFFSSINSVFYVKVAQLVIWVTRRKYCYHGAQQRKKKVNFVWKKSVRRFFLSLSLVFLLNNEAFIWYCCAKLCCF